MGVKRTSCLHNFKLWVLQAGKIVVNDGSASKHSVVRTLIKLGTRDLFFFSFFICAAFAHESPRALLTLSSSVIVNLRSSSTIFYKFSPITKDTIHLRKVFFLVQYDNSITSTEYGGMYTSICGEFFDSAKIIPWEHKAGLRMRIKVVKKFAAILLRWEVNILMLLSLCSEIGIEQRFFS